MKPEPLRGIVPLSNSGQILALVASPTKNEILVQSEAGEADDDQGDAYGGTLYFVNLSGPQPSAQQIVSRDNVISYSSPVWDAKGSLAYFTYDNGTCAPSMGSSICGIFTFNTETGKITHLLGDATAGLAISPDGSLLAFWDYTIDNKLAVLNVNTHSIVKSWAGEVHDADEAGIDELAFARDAKSILASTYDGNEIPLKQFDLSSGEVRIISPYGRYSVVGEDALYFVQFGPAGVNFVRSETLMKISSGNPDPAKVLDLRYGASLEPSGNPRWLVFRDSWNGIQLFDTRTQKIVATAKNCTTAVSMPDGKIVYGTRGQLVYDPAACTGPNPGPR